MVGSVFFPRPLVRLVEAFAALRAASTSPVQKSAAAFLQVSQGYLLVVATMCLARSMDFRSRRPFPARLLEENREAQAEKLQSRILAQVATKVRDDPFGKVTSCRLFSRGRRELRSRVV